MLGYANESWGTPTPTLEQAVGGRRGYLLFGKGMDLRPFQQRFIRRATAPGVVRAAMSLPRGNGKSTFAGWLGARIMTPGDDLYRAGTESIFLAGSLEQARIVFRAARRELGEMDTVTPTV